MPNQNSKYEFKEAEDSYIKENYLKQTRISIATHLNISHNVIRRRMKELGLVVPESVSKGFKTHKGEKYKKEKARAKAKAKAAAKKSQTSNRKAKVQKEDLPKFKMKHVDYSLMEMYKIDNKTWKYRPK